MVSIVFFVRKFKVFFVGSLKVGDIFIISKYNLKIVNMMKKKFKWVLV